MIATLIKFPEPFTTDAKDNKLQKQPHILTLES